MSSRLFNLFISVTSNSNCYVGRSVHAKPLITYVYNWLKNDDDDDDDDDDDNTIYN
jgi:hypothetical protein